MSRYELKNETVDLGAMAHNIAMQLREHAPDRQGEFNIQSDIAAQGDAHLLRIVLENLLGNAWKFTGKQPCAEIRFGVNNTNDRPTYYVGDNGAGFDMRYAEQLFRPFQRLHKASEFEGTGIGLATVRRIIQRHGGDIRVEAAVDTGATFYFTLADES